MAEAQPPVALQNPTEPDAATAEIARHLLVSTWIESTGVVGSAIDGAYEVTETDPASMAVLVDIPAAGRTVIVPGTRTGDLASTQGPYLCFAADDVELDIDAADPADDRNDLVVARVFDSFQNGTFDDTWALEVVTGTPDAVPSDPTVPDDSLTVARVRVGAGVTEITDDDIDDLRTFAKIREELLPDLIASNISVDDYLWAVITGDTVQEAFDSVDEELVAIADSVAEVPLASVLLDSAAASIDITDIPQDYKHLRIVFVGRSDRPSTEIDGVNVRINGDTGSNYDVQSGDFSAASPDSAESFAGDNLFVGTMVLVAADADTDVAAVTNFTIFDYAATNWQKNAVGSSGRKRGTTSGDLLWRAIYGSWRSTVAVTRLTFTPANGPNFVAGTRVDVYGIRGAA